MTTTATPNLGEVAEFWRVARRLYTVYAELDRTSELAMPPCAELADAVDRRRDRQHSGVVREVAELRWGVGRQCFEPAFLVAFTRFNFLARRAFFRAMHLDLHAIRSAVNRLEELGFSTIDCRDAGLTE